MGGSTGYGIALWPLAFYFGVILIAVAGMLAASHFLGERHRARSMGEPYESGILPTGSARQRISAHFYLVAMFFVVFDLEAAFILAWAIGFRASGWMGFVGIASFIGTLVIALIYLWRQGALDWGSRPRRTK